MTEAFNERGEIDDEALGLRKTAGEIVDIRARNEKRNKQIEENRDRILDEHGTNEEGARVNIGLGARVTMDDYLAMTRGMKARIEKYEAENADPKTDDATRRANEEKIRGLRQELNPHQKPEKPREDLDIAA